MDKFSTKIAEIKSKVQKLLSLHTEALAQKEQLKKENEVLKKDLERQSKLITELNEKVKIIQISNTLSTSAEDTKALRSRVNELIREVDKCISLLNN